MTLTGTYADAPQTPGTPGRPLDLAPTVGRRSHRCASVSGTAARAVSRCADVCGMAPAGSVERRWWQLRCVWRGAARGTGGSWRSVRPQVAVPGGEGSSREAGGSQASRVPVPSGRHAQPGDSSHPCPPGSRPKFPVKLLSGRGASPGAPILGDQVHRHPGLIQTSRLPSGPHVMLLELTELFLAPALTHADEYGKDQLHSTGLVPEMRNDFGPTPFLCKGPFRQVRRAHILAMPCGHLQVIETGLGIVLQTPARLWEGIVIRRQQGLLTALTFLKRRRIPHVGDQGFAGRPRLRGHLLVEMLHRMKPTAHPQRARPHTVHRLDQAWRPVRGDRHGRLQPTFDQIPPHLQTTRITFTMGGREGQ